MRSFSIEDAVTKLVVSLEELPSFTTTYRFLASCYVHMGRLDEAQEVVNRLRAITSVVVPTVTNFRNLEHRDLFLSGLRLAAGEATLLAHAFPRKDEGLLMPPSPFAPDSLVEQSGFEPWSPL